VSLVPAKAKRTVTNFRAAARSGTAGVRHRHYAASRPGSAAAFFDTLAQFYRKAYLRYIDATTRRPDLRAARIAEVAGLLAAGIKERPRS